MPVPKVKELTIKERKFVTEYLKSGNATDAVLRSYNVKSKKNASKFAHEIKVKPHIKSAIDKALRHADLTPTTIANTLKKAINAGVGIRATNSDTLRGIDLYAKLTGAYERMDIEVDPKQAVRKLDHDTLVNELRRRRDIGDTVFSDGGIVI